jgi:hypothetical protein
VATPSWRAFEPTPDQTTTTTKKLDPGFDAPEPARRRRGDPASDRAGDADASSDSSDDDSCALIGVVNPVEPLGVFVAERRKFRKRDRNGFCFLAF